MSSDYSYEIRIAFEGNISFNRIQKSLEARSRTENIRTIIYIGPFDNQQQEFINSNSALAKFTPDLTCLILDARQIFREIILNPLGSGGNYREEQINYWRSEIKRLAESFCRNISGQLLIHNFIVPDRSVLGIADIRHPDGVKLLLQKFNIWLAEEFAENEKICIVDIDAIASRVGKLYATDERMYYFGKFLFGKALIPALCEEYMRYIRLKCFSPRKCLVLDLDNTLWGGIVGEDGPEGIQLGDDPPGNSFKEFQRLLLGFYHRGILLAINSRNNPEDAWECILNHPHMVLSKKHFAAAQINWDDKVTNMRRLAEELNIGLESLVFVDDDSYNREMVREALPMVQVIDLPLDSAEYINVLLNEAHLDVLTITDEDAKRGEYYQQEKERTVFAQRYENIEDYLRSLDIQVTVNFVDNYSLSRVSQLTMRTNQFNMTNRRYSESDIRKLASSSRHRIYTVSMCDRFGDNGIVGTAIVELLEDSWRLDTFLMSCRVLGRGCETTLLAVIADDARQHGASRFLGEFIPTRKNKPAEQFFAAHGFTLKGDTGESQNWELNLQAKQVPVPDYIKLIRSNPTEQSNQEQAPKSK